MKVAAREDSLQTEFKIDGKLDRVVKVVEDAVSVNHFVLQPYRFSDHSKERKAFHVMHFDEKKHKMNCCGALELINKGGNETLIRLDSTKGTALTDTRKNTISLERVFFVILQRLIQQGMYRVNK